MVHDAEFVQAEAIGTTFDAAAKYRLKVLPVVGDPNAVAL
jgi:hypothetical protein